MAEMLDMTKIVEPDLPEPRYAYGGDEWAFCEIDEAMSFHANFKAFAICQELASTKIDGISEICPANASYIVRFDPDIVHPRELISHMKRLYEEVSPEETTFHARVVDVPMLYDDPWTHECIMRFRDHHQSATQSDIEYVTSISGFTAVADFIDRHSGSPWYVTMVGFVPGCPWCFQMVPRGQILQAPKYVRPRTDTPALAVSFGGAFTAMYPVRGPGGFQLLGMAAAPIFDPTQTLFDFKESVGFPRCGDIFNFRPIARDEFDSIRAKVQDRTFRYRTVQVEFEPRAFFDNPQGYNRDVIARLYQ